MFQLNFVSDLNIFFDEIYCFDLIFVVLFADAIDVYSCTLYTVHCTEQIVLYSVSVQYTHREIHTTKSYLRFSSKINSMIN